MKKIKFIAGLMIILSITVIPLLAWAQSNGGEKGISEISMNIQKADKQKDIVDIAIGDGRFKTLTAALKAADLVETLKGKGPFTVFAPTDDAFGKIPKETLDSLLKPENKEALTNILTYHVLSGKVSADQAKKLDGKEITMVNGDKAKISLKDGSLYINDAKVIITDIMAKNGVIHVIDTVIMPK